MQYAQFDKGILHDNSLSQNAKKTYISLVYFRNFTTGECFPSRSSMSSIFGMKIHNIDKGLKELEEHGHIKKTKRSKGNTKKLTSNSYEIVDCISILIKNKKTPKRRNREWTGEVKEAEQHRKFNSVVSL